MPDEPSPESIAKAARLRAKIDKLTRGTKTPVEGEEPGNTADKAPLAPRDFIHQWMAEHDKKPGKK